MRGLLRIGQLASDGRWKRRSLCVEEAPRVHDDRADPQCLPLEARLVIVGSYREQPTARLLNEVEIERNRHDVLRRDWKCRWPRLPSVLWHRPSLRAPSSSGRSLLLLLEARDERAELLALTSAVSAARTPCARPNARARAQDSRRKSRRFFVLRARQRPRRLGDVLASRDPSRVVADVALATRLILGFRRYCAQSGQ